MMGRTRKSKFGDGTPSEGRKGTMMAKAKGAAMRSEQPSPEGIARMAAMMEAARARRMTAGARPMPPQASPQMPPQAPPQMPPQMGQAPQQPQMGAPQAPAFKKGGMVRGSGIASRTKKCKMV